MSEIIRMNDLEELNTSLKSQGRFPVVYKKHLIFGLITVLAILLAGAVLVYFSQRKIVNTDTQQGANIKSSNQELADKSAKVKEFVIDGSNFKYVPSEVTVKKGDSVKIIFKNSKGTHNLVIDGYNLSTDIIPEGKEDAIEFVADKQGKFDFYCSVANHRTMGMTGILLVE